MSRLLVVFLLAAAGCASMHEPERTALATMPSDETLLRDSVAAVRPGSIGYGDALAIAKYYLSRHGRQQAIVTRLTDQGGHWEAEVASRYQGFSSLPLVIDKFSGGVRWAQGPTVRSVEELLKN